MREKLGQRKIKYQAELDMNFGREISEKYGGENLHQCIQCGTCSATCPMSLYMDYTPRRLVAMTREGFKDEVLKSFTIWLCASCYSCTVDCPKEIKITQLMYAFKQKAIEEGVYPKRFATPVLAREFFKNVRRWGRSNEGILLMNMFLKTNPFKLFKQSFLGMKLLWKGRMPLKIEKIKGMNELKPILDAVEK
ncbi:MAG: 4Fe-4S dicluster domain-containing protein [Candidatus Omnitrophica bacterium]|nr:4Fe-4S dicluster domain-containing protein [Candidatus Omnitrophota bacterium]